MEEKRGKSIQLLQPVPLETFQHDSLGTPREKASKVQRARLELLPIPALARRRCSPPLSPPCGEQHYKVQPGTCRADPAVQ